ncbi:extracellular solute-binding protein [Erysipelothrix sp. HDW6C]|uniref:extracellular solute-binding protein n=1 Tax=Erysipelothrix sp. HDW6C TaxID=2714930 RepID=UPI00140E3E2F|nr:extracellular solute-binding protein [Erysipelothrix sp. HDW6C]QIK68855.1 extracellular solute-binding protein [Erysipelothrix sp. HDW6C]
MKQNKPAIIGLVFVLLIALVTTSYFILSNRCTLDGASVCFDKETQTFGVEKDAALLVQVESKEVGEFLVAKWNELHPDFNGAVTYKVEAPLTLDEMALPFETDIIVASQNNAAFYFDRFYDLGGKMDSVVGSKTPSQLQDTMNVKGYYFVQNSVTGPVFAYNETLMKELGFDLTDADNSGLPDVFETWDDIIEKAPKITEKINVVFPLTFTDQSSFYPFFTGGRWTLNFTKNGSKPGFDTREFREGLSLIESLGPVVLDKTVAEEVKPPEAEKETTEITDKETTEVADTETTDGEVVETTETEITEAETPKEPEVPKVFRNSAESLKWQYEQAFFSRQSLFTIVNDFDLTSKYAAQTGDTYVYAPFPSYGTHRLSPQADVEGYAVRKEVAYPSASAEVLRILRSGEAVSVYHNSTQKIPVYHRTYLDELTIENPTVMQRVLAYNFSDALPVMALNNNPDVLARSIYTEVDFMPTMRELFNGKITVDEAQEKIAKLAQVWVDKNDIIKEE